MISLFLALFLDEDSMDTAVLRGFRSQGIDVTTVSEAGRLGMSDLSHLNFAASEQRCIYSSNAADFSRLHALLLRKGEHHSGIIVMTGQRLDVGAQIRALTRLANRTSAEGMRDRLEYLRNWL